MRPEVAERAKALAKGKSLRALAEALAEEGFTSAAGNPLHTDVVKGLIDG